MTALGIDIGGTKCAVSIGTAVGADCGGGIDILSRTEFSTASGGGPQGTIDRIILELRKLVDGREGSLEAGLDSAAAELRRIGISCGGPLDTKRGLILSPPNLPGWDAIPIVDIIQEAFGLPALLRNDADACALAEWKFGAGRGCGSMVFMTFGTGLGSGLILNGKLYTGACGMAGELGHLRMEETGPIGYGKAGSWEGFCSGGGIAQLAKTMASEALHRGEAPMFCPDAGSLEAIDAKKVAEAAKAGDPLAKEIYRISGTYLGKGLSLLIDQLNPERIVIGGIFARSRELLWPAAEAVIERECLRCNREACRIMPAELGDRVGDIAALTLALHG